MSSDATSQHRAAAKSKRACCAVLTVSDTRTPETDASGRRIRDLLTVAGHEVVGPVIAPDEPDAIDRQLGTWLDAEPPATAGRPDCILTNGGTGVAPRDTTIEVVQRRLTKQLPGFGELFRMLSYDQVGAAAMLSRAVAGLAGSSTHPTLLFAMPGSTAAVELAMTKLILPELPHLLWESRR